MRKSIVLAAMISALLTVPVMAEDADPLALGASFCRIGSGGTADRSLFTKSLLDAMDAAQAASDKYEAANPGDKPPLGDGIPFQSFPDVADSCGPANLKASDGTAEMDIQYQFKASPEGNFTDRLVVKTENGRPLIDDVLYGSDDYKSSLRQVLADIAAGKL